MILETGNWWNSTSWRFLIIHGIIHFTAKGDRASVGGQESEGGVRGRCGRWAYISPSLEPPEGVTCILPTCGSKAVGGGDAGASRPPLRTTASLAQSITIGNSSQAWQYDLSSGASTWARPRHSTQSLCASEKSTGLPHMRQRDILSVILYSAGMQEGIAICVVHSSRVGQWRNQAPGEGERFWGILAPDPPT